MSGLGRAVTRSTIARSPGASWYGIEIRHMRSEIAWLTRAVPTASKGFIAAISRKPSSAGTRPSLGTCSSPSASAPTSTFSVSSGTRLSSSM